ERHAIISTYNNNENDFQFYNETCRLSSTTFASLSMVGRVRHWLHLPPGRVPQACGYYLGASPKPSASCASAGHESSKSVFHPSWAPVDLHLSSLRRSTPRSSTGMLL